MLRTYKNHSNCFISKPVTMEEFDKVIRTLEDFWFMIVRLPQERDEKSAAEAGEPGGK